MNIELILHQQNENLKSANYAGWDVFDGLNSTLFNKIPFQNNRYFRLAWIQFFKKAPINFRTFVGIGQGHNAKGLALFIQGNIFLYKKTGQKKYIDTAYSLADLIRKQTATDRDYFCVGYNFPWQARAFYVPAFKPNMIVSSFVGQAFLDLYDLDNNRDWLNLAIDISEFINSELTLLRSDDHICYGYIPGEEARVHNANLMGGRLMARLYHYTQDKKYQDNAVKSVNYSIQAQSPDGAWPYGERGHHQWVDNFHTGFNLVAINDVQRYLNDGSWQENIEIGLEYHLKNHFLDDMTPKYYDNKIYPIDIHNYAQGIDTMLTFGLKDKASLLLENGIKNFWSAKKHYFYYQKNKYFINKLNYIRWSQAWMFYAMSKYWMLTDD